MLKDEVNKIIDDITNQCAGKLSRDMNVNDLKANLKRFFKLAFDKGFEHGMFHERNMEVKAMTWDEIQEGLKEGKIYKRSPSITSSFFAFTNFVAVKLIGGLIHFQPVAIEGAISSMWIYEEPSISDLKLTWEEISEEDKPKLSDRMHGEN